MNLKGGDPTLRNAEHYLFRRWIASERERGAVTIPDGLPFMAPGPYNPTLVMNAGVMSGMHDLAYNPIREHVLQRLFNINKTTPDMEYFEEAGYRAGEATWKQFD